MPNQFLINKLILQNFRNFENQKFIFDNQQIFLSGKNGSGKSNVLESLTILGRTPSIRNSDFDEMLKIDAPQFSVFGQVSGHDFIEKISVNFVENPKKKNLEINGESINIKRQGDVKNHLPNFIFLTPQLEQLFISGKANRRTYLDHIVADIDLLHQNRLNDYQKLLRERLLILQKYQQQSSSKKWLETIENKIVETAIAIGSARIEAIEFFNKAIKSFDSNFPQTTLQIIGDVEQAINKQSSLQIESFYHEKLQNNRKADLENFKTNFGIHRSDFDAIFCTKNLSAILSSTGEQKAIMIAITIARAKICSQYRNQPTILIFDEIVSHLDDKRKIDLLSEIGATNLQCFFSATNFELVPFELRGKISEIKIDNSST